MASNGSKFFTWTKGDRKNVSHGMVQIPVECIAIKDMGYGRSTKTSRRAGRKPLPLNFVDMKPEHSGAQTHDSSTLHDAAVRSATSLLAAMSDVLKSPQFISGQSSDLLQPVHGRPRSRTAPPTPATPLVEAPPIDPVELPAPDMTWQNTPAPGSKPVVGRAIYSNIANVEPPRCYSQTHSSTNQVLHKETAWTSGASSGLSETTSTRPSIDSSLRNNSEDMVRRTVNRSQGSLSGPEAPTPSSTPERNTLRTSAEMRKLSYSPDRVVAGHAGERITSATSPAAALQSTKGDDALSAKTELMAHVHDLRTTHESHISALKEAHSRELAALGAYITLLESQQPSAKSTTFNNPQVAGSDHPSARNDVDLSYSGPDSAQSVRTMAPKEDLIDARSSTQIEIHGLRRERDYFRSLSQQVQEKNTVLEDNLSQAKKTEAALDNVRSALEASVTAANMQRIDALSTLDHAHEDLRATRQREDLLRSELDELRQSACRDELKHFKTVRNIDSKNIGNYTSPPGKAATRPHRSSTADAKNDKSCVVAKRTSISSATESDSLRAQLLVCQSELQTAKSDRERYNVLLHSELRRQSKLAAYQTHTETPEIQQRASVAMASRRSRGCSASELATQCTVDALKACVAERELRYCFEEIIMYKLDIKGYKKDLKSAHARIASLESNALPKTPERGPRSNSKTDYDITPPCDRSLGLGILSLEAACPTLLSSKTAPTTSPPAPSTTYQATTLSLASPTRLDYQPASIHKALPEPPPPYTPSPKQLSNNSFPHTSLFAQKAHHLQRTETLRSLSESIISSYTKRGTNTDEGEDVPPLPPARHRRSESARTESKRGGEAVMLSISKVSADMVKTPVVGLTAVGG